MVHIEADLRDHAAEIRVGVTEVAHRLDNFAVIQAKAGEILHGGDGGEAFHQRVIGFAQEEHQRVFL